MASIITIGGGAQVVVEQGVFGVGDDFGLIHHFDAGLTTSYSGSGTTWTNLGKSTLNATINGSPPHTSGSAGYFTFSPAAHWASVPSLTDFDRPGNGDFTFVWVGDVAVVQNKYLYDWGDSGANQIQASYGLVNGFDNFKYADLGVNALGLGNIYTEGPTPVINTWYHIVIRRTGLDHVMFVDGSEVVATLTNTGTKIDINTPELFLGRYNQVAGALNHSGKYAAFQFWNRALTDTEISDNFTYFSNRGYTNYWTPTRWKTCMTMTSRIIWMISC